jgi:hypothetical protein
MSKAKVLIQLDPDAHASVFDAMVAIDAGVDHLLQYHGVQPDQVRDLVHGAIFTRGPKELNNTAIFLGGSNVEAAETLLQKVRECFFGPMSVSVMLDANGANTTAVAAVLAAARHASLRGATALVLAGTGPVGQRVVRLLAREGANVHVASRRRDRAQAVCTRIGEQIGGVVLTPFETNSAASVAAAAEGVQIVIAAGAAGIELLPADVRRNCRSLRVAIDLNAVPPVGIAGVEATDKAVERDGAICYGAIGVGGTKMKIHAAAIARLFESRSQVLDAEEIYAIGLKIEN